MAKVDRNNQQALISLSSRFLVQCCIQSGSDLILHANHPDVPGTTTLPLRPLVTMSTTASATVSGSSNGLNHVFSGVRFRINPVRVKPCATRTVRTRGAWYLVVSSAARPSWKATAAALLAE